MLVSTGTIKCKNCGITKKADKSGKAFDGRNGNQIQDWMTKFDLFGPSIICRWCYKKLYIKKKKLEKANHTSSQAPRPKIAKFTTIPIYRFNIFAPNWDINPCTGVTSSKYSDGLFEIFGRNVVRPSDTLITFGF